VANLDPLGSNRTVEQWLIELEREIAELKMHFHNFLEMRRQAAHMEARYTDRAGGHNAGNTRTRQERQKKPRG
jgi:hypothetical protein